MKRCEFARLHLRCLGWSSYLLFHWERLRNLVQ